MEHIIHRVLARGVAKGVEKAEWEIAAAIDSKTDLGDHVGWCRRCLGAANGAGHVGIADAELVVVPSVGAEMLSFDLQGIVHVRACVSHARVHHLREGLVRSNLVTDADRCCRHWKGSICVIIDRHGIVQWNVARDGGVAGHTILHRSASCPEDYGCRVRVTRGNSMSKVQA